MILIIKNRNRTFSLFDISRFWNMSKLNTAPFGVYIMSICGNLYSPLGIVVGSERFEPAHVGSILPVSECPERSFGDIRNCCLGGVHMARLGPWRGGGWCMCYSIWSFAPWLVPMSCWSQNNRILDMNVTACIWDHRQAFLLFFNSVYAYALAVLSCYQN